jgi:hypothetical protein
MLPEPLKKQLLLVKEVGAVVPNPLMMFSSVAVNSRPELLCSDASAIATKLLFRICTDAGAFRPADNTAAFRACAAAIFFARFVYVLSRFRPAAAACFSACRMVALVTATGGEEEFGENLVEGELREL